MNVKRIKTYSKKICHSFVLLTTFKQNVVYLSELDDIAFELRFCNVLWYWKGIRQKKTPQKKMIML